MQTISGIPVTTAGLAAEEVQYQGEEIVMVTGQYLTIATEIKADTFFVWMRGILRLWTLWANHRICEFSDTKDALTYTCGMVLAPVTINCGGCDGCRDVRPVAGLLEEYDWLPLNATQPGCAETYYPDVLGSAGPVQDLSLVDIFWLSGLHELQMHCSYMRGSREYCVALHVRRDGDFLVATFDDAGPIS